MTVAELIDKQKQKKNKYETLNGQSQQMLKHQQYKYNHDFLFSLTLATGCLMISLKLYSLLKNDINPVNNIINNSVNK